MKLQIRTNKVWRWRLLTSFRIQDLEAAKGVAQAASALSMASGDQPSLRILDGEGKVVLVLVRPLEWLEPITLKGRAWVP